MPWHHSNFMILDNCSQLKREKNVMRIGTKSIHTVSPARISGSSKPRDCLLKSRSQHRNREAPKCLIPSMHCNMVTSAVQNTPCLLERYREKSHRNIRMSMIRNPELSTTDTCRERTCWPFSTSPELNKKCWKLLSLSSQKLLFGNKCRGVKSMNLEFDIYKRNVVTSSTPISKQFPMKEFIYHLCN